MRTHFSVLGVDQKYRVDPVELERRYHELSKQMHPDRHATGTPKERLLAVQMTTELNDAFRTLKDDVKRAEYLLKLEGIDVSEEKRADSAAAARETRPMVVSAGLLMEVMELRESLAEARAEKNERRIAGMVDEVKGKRSAAMTRVADGFVALETGDRSKLGEIAADLVGLRYYARFLDEVDAHRNESEGT